MSLMISLEDTFVGPGVGGGGGDSHIKVMWVIVGNFEKNPLKSTRILFIWGVVQKNFIPKRYQNQLTDINFTSSDIF